MISVKFFEDMYFWVEGYKKMKKIKFRNFLEHPLYEGSEYAFKLVTYAMAIGIFNLPSEG